MLMLRKTFILLAASEMAYTVRASNDTNTTDASYADDATGNNTDTTTTTTTTTASNTTSSNSTTTTAASGNASDTSYDYTPTLSQPELPCETPAAFEAYSMPDGGEPTNYGTCQIVTEGDGDFAQEKCIIAHDLATHICDKGNEKALEHLSATAKLFNKNYYNAVSNYTEAHAKFDCMGMTESGGKTTSSGCEWLEDTNNGGLGKCVSAATKPYKTITRLEHEQHIANGFAYCNDFEPTAEKCETETYTDLTDGAKNKNCAILSLETYMAGELGLAMGLMGPSGAAELEQALSDMSLGGDTSGPSDSRRRASTMTGQDSLEKKI